MKPPFFWAGKDMMRRIHKRCEDPGTALAVYVALTIAASDEGKDEFQSTHAHLASLCGFSVNTVRRRLADLAQIGAVAITTPAMKAPCTYRLLERDTFAHGGRTFAHGPTLSVGEIRRKEEKKELLRLNDERSSFNTHAVHRSSFNRAKSEAENKLLKHLADVLGAKEMHSNGGNWRVHWVREYPALVERGLAELEAQLREGKRIGNRGAYLTDLLNRWK
jgi:hypothetical protein